MVKKKDANAALQAVHNIYNTFPSFTDIFDEESWYIFAFCLTTAAIIVAFVASRFIVLKELH